jgi:hypothetical protein
MLSRRGITRTTAEGAGTVGTRVGLKCSKCGATQFVGGPVSPDVMRLADAGVREREYAVTLHQSGAFPPHVSVEDVLAHGMYDARTDSILLLTIVAQSHRVERA